MFIVVQDSTGRISLINEYTQLMLGLDEPALFGRHLWKCSAAGAPTALNTFSLPLQEEKTLLTPDHNTHTIAWYHAPLPTGSDGKVSRISVGLDISERKAAEARLIWLAERDPLTELYNRRYFQNALQTAIERPDNVQGAILLLDLDQFKEVNELSGHHVGDRVLAQLRTPSSIILEAGASSRAWGGDEFSLLLEDINAEQAVSRPTYCFELLDGISFLVGERRHRVTASIGIALFPHHGSSPAELMASADVAMYKAKASNLQHWHLLRKWKMLKMNYKNAFTGLNVFVMHLKKIVLN